MFKLKIVGCISFALLSTSVSAFVYDCDSQVSRFDKFAEQHRKWQADHCGAENAKASAELEDRTTARQCDLWESPGRFDTDRDAKLAWVQRNCKK